MTQLTKRNFIACGLLLGMEVLSNRALQAGVPPSTWHATGTLLEACSCSVPCPCNFGQAPTDGRCETIYAYRLKTAQYKGVKLDGLIIAGGEGPNGASGFLDERATSEQRTALEQLALAMFKKGGASTSPRKFEFVALKALDDSKSFQVKFGASGGFEADLLIGRDHKHPIVVENNSTWPVDRFNKGKTTSFDYHDSLGNILKYDGVNANLGEFNLSD